GGQHDPPSKSQVKMVQDAYWDYVQKSTMTPKDYVWDIRHSHPGQYLCSLIAESFEIISTFLYNVHTHMVWWIKDFYSRFCHEVDHLQHDLDHFLLYLEAETHSHAKELADQIRWRLEDIKKCAAHYAEALDPGGLKVALVQKIQDLKKTRVSVFQSYILINKYHRHFTESKTNHTDLKKYVSINMF
uniref:Uncharacterized protein n=1 Tax=Poecilia mexicana TaxID=48701 RepID=A0A3B3Z5M8_9TELE